MLTNEEQGILQLGLKHGLASRPNQSGILVYADVSEQIKDTLNAYH